MNPGRLAAARALIAIERGSHAEDALAELAPAATADRGLAWHLCLGVCRRRGTLDAMLGPQLRKGGVEALDLPVQAALRIGLFELLFSRTPPHAAVSEAVELSRKLGAGRASGLVNAVLRKTAQMQVPEDPFLDLPPWLQQRWAAYPGWVARLREPAPLCGAWRDQPVPDLVARPASAGGEPVPGAFELQAATGPVEAMPGFAEGRWWVMDPSAVRVADLALEAAKEGRGGESPRVLDACAAPGGKTLRLASRGARVGAVDLQANRLERVRQNLDRTGLAVEGIQVWDWLDGSCPALDRRFDAVLVDAPCTGLGTLRRHPEIRWRRLPSDPAAMALRQRQILENASQHVADGGALVHAVCSPMPEEGLAVAESLPGWRIERSWAAVPPQADEDAFQAFVLRRG